MDYSLPGSSLFMELFGQEHWSGLPFASPGDVPEPAIKPASLVLAGDSLPLNHLGSPHIMYYT